MSQYRLKQESGIQHGSMQCIMNVRNKTVTLSTVVLLSRDFGIPLTEFLDSDFFRSDELEMNNKTPPQASGRSFWVDKPTLVCYNLYDTIFALETPKMFQILFKTPKAVWRFL